MPSLIYETLGSISGVTTDPKSVPGSVRSRDRNARQRLALECDSDRPFTGTIYIQASIGDPTNETADQVWFTIVEMIINNEGGTWSFEPEGEFNSIRVICPEGNYWSSTNGTDGANTGTAISAQTFTIDGISITVPNSADAATVAALINLTPGIDAANVVADVINQSSLRIYKTSGEDMVLADTSATPLANLGLATGTIKGGVISKIRMLR